MKLQLLTLLWVGIATLVHSLPVASADVQDVSIEEASIADANGVANVKNEGSSTKKYLRRLPVCKHEKEACETATDCCRKDFVCRKSAPGTKGKKCLSCCKKLKECTADSDCCSGLTCSRGICL